MRTVYLYGKLAEEFGPSFRVRGNTIGACVSVLEANFRGKFIRGVMNGYYRVVAGASLDDINGIQFDNALVKQELSLGSKDLHIMPVAEGSGGGGGFFKIVLGVALIAAAAFLPAAGAFSGYALGSAASGFAVSWSSVALMGASLIFQGAASLLTPTPKVSAQQYTERNSVDARPSFIFNGAINTTEQGGPVTVIYGRMVVGSTVISGGITAEQI